MGRKKFSKYMSRIAVMLLVLAMIFSMSACSGSGADKIKLGGAGSSGEQGNAYLHTASAADTLKSVSSSGLVELMFDESLYSVCVKDTSYDRLWTSLPDNENFEAAVAKVRIISGSKIYELNTQDHSVAFGKAKAEVASDGVKVTYILTPDSKTAKKESYSASDVAFKLVIDYRLTDGSMYVSAKAENLVADSDAKLINLTLLEYFGSDIEAEQGDYIFVPDGSGALMRIDTAHDDFKKPLEFEVYGSDAATNDGESDKYSAVVPAYGMKRGKSAFVILITEGDAIASISADRVRDDNKFFKVGSSFEITPSTVESVKDEEAYVSEASYDGKIELCVRFLHGSNANYTGMAAAVREQLIRTRVLSTKTVVTHSEYLPLDLSVIGVADDALFSIGKFSLNVQKTFTDFEQAQDMVMRMKAKGINGINMRYKGALSGGYDQSEITSAKLLRRLGSNGDLEELISYMSAQNMGVYLDINILSSAKSLLSSRKTATNIFGKKTEYLYQSNIAPLIGKDVIKKQLISADKINRAIVDVLGNSKFNDFTGICINDVGNVLYSDFASRRNRQQVANIISDELPPLTAGRILMADNGNFFMIKDVEVISHIPTGANASTGKAYESVPFVQLVLHGIVEYSSEPINLSDDSKTAMLRCVEYGANPSYEWSYEQTAKDGKADNLYYENWINSAADFYTKANDALADLRSSRMTSHEEIMDNVFCTEYDTGAMVYVNYTEKDVVVSGITIPAGDFLRIN